MPSVLWKLTCAAPAFRMSASTPPAACSTAPTPAFTRSSPSASSSRDAAEIVAVMDVCARHGAPVLPRGGGTSLAGQTVGHAVVLDASRHLNRVLEINREEAVDPLPAGPGAGSPRTRHVPGWPDVGTGPGQRQPRHGRRHGRQQRHGHALDPLRHDRRQRAGRACRVQRRQWWRGSTTASTRRPGRRAARRQPSPRVWTAFSTVGRRHPPRLPRHWRRASGYNLDRLLNAATPNPAQLIAGSEGTLAFMAEVTMRLVPRPPGAVLGIVHFDDLVAAAEATPAILELQPSAVELMDRMLLDLCRRQPEFARQLTFVAGDPAGVLAVEFYVASEAEGRARLDALRAQLARQGVHGAVVDVFDAAGQANVWAVRKAGLSLLLSKRGDIKPAGFMEDVAVPPEHLADYVRGVQQMFAEYGVEAAFYAHASAGCLHIRPLLNLKTAADIAVMDAMQSRLLAMIQPVGGVLSGEHGDGIKLTHLNQALFGPRVSEAFAQTKLLFDPDNLFNPGKKVLEEVLAEVDGRERRETGETRERRENEGSGAVVVHVTDVAELRFGPGYRTVAFTPLLDWSVDGGFAGAVEMCNGSGDCRKLTGVMCPSFHATREEEHSTRGRANLLRTALSGQLDDDAWTSDAVHDALDLCLGCKACKVECPRRWTWRRSRPRRWRNATHVTGRRWPRGCSAGIHTLNRLAAPVAPLANLALATPPGRWAAQQVTNLAPQRSLPSFASQPFTTWFAARLRSSASRSPAPLVFLYPDTFTNYNYPKVGIAAVHVLESAGFEVQLAPQACCGRPMLSQGLVEDTRGGRRAATWRTFIRWPRRATRS